MEDASVCSANGKPIMEESFVQYDSKSISQKDQIHTANQENSSRFNPIYSNH